MLDNFQIAIDTREQKPYSFENSVTKTLKTGDYSIVGMEEMICLERKSSTDAYGSLGKGRERLEREFQRMANMEYSAMVIESTMRDFMKQPKYSKMNPSSAMNTLISWNLKYGVSIWFAGDRLYGRKLVLRLLEKFYKQKVG